MKHNRKLALFAVIMACGIITECGENKSKGLLLELNQLIPNQSPIADAGADRTAYLYAGITGSVNIDGSGSYDPDGGNLTYRWSIAFQPSGSAASFTKPSGAATAFTFDSLGTYEIMLTVKDGLRSASDLVTVYVGSNTGATSDAGTDQEVTMGDVVILDGSGSTDPENDPLAYTWTQISGPAIGTGTLTGPTPAFTAPSMVCTIVYDLQVDDGGGSSTPDRVYIFIMEKGGAGIYVSTALGDDANTGTDRSAPKSTIQSAVTAALALDRDVYISDGDYGESVVLANGVSIYGGFNHNTWERNTASFRSAIQGDTIAIDGNGVGDLVLDGLSITSAGATMAGGGSYGVRLIYSTVTLRDCVITAGNGAPGVNGSNGGNGSPGGSGGTGGPGYDDCLQNDDGTRGYGGSGGSSPVGRNGGMGGTGGHRDFYKGQRGATGVIIGGGGGTGGAGGTYGDDDGGNGNAGTPGSGGANGSGGSIGSVKNNLWVSSPGSNGAAGGDGNGGGGGGGGGNDYMDSCRYKGNGGGGGGGGGAKGTGGNGGTGGGGSFGLFMNESNVTVENCIITSGNGGVAGSGGTGGSGGSGGPGGLGGTAHTSDDRAGRGGNGGAGGIGGSGGHGGGGAGGPSYSIYKNGLISIIDINGTTLIYGSGGPGGASSGNAGATGDSGQYGGSR